MWFGDLVTMRWWDDLWLNESFAEYLGHRVCAAHRRRRGVGGVRHRPQVVGLRRRPAAVHAPGGRQRRRRHGAARSTSSTASPTPRARRCCASWPRGSATTSSSTACAATSRRTPTATRPSPTCSPRGRRPARPSLPEWADAWLRTSGLDTLRRRRRRPAVRGSLSPPSGRVSTPSTSRRSTPDGTELAQHGRPPSARPSSPDPPAALVLPDVARRDVGQVVLPIADWTAMPALFPGLTTRSPASSCGTRCGWPPPTPRSRRRRCSTSLAAVTDESDMVLSHLLGWAVAHGGRELRRRRAAPGVPRRAWPTSARPRCTPLRPEAAGSSPRPGADHRDAGRRVLRSGWPAAHRRGSSSMPSCAGRWSTASPRSGAAGRRRDRRRGRARPQLGRARACRAMPGRCARTARRRQRPGTRS